MSDKIFVTVQGADKIGIVAKVTETLAKFDVNIEDIKQTLIQGHFVMFMLCNISNSKSSFKQVKEGLSAIGEDMGLEIWVQKKEIFDNMHKI